MVFFDFISRHTRLIKHNINKKLKKADVKYSPAVTPSESLLKRVYVSPVAKPKIKSIKKPKK
ncbi:hypothetical protein CHA01nite_24270 [Chryseobacterium hagamense]|uniref:Uncharacterized protein n=1 Tax=Chryseobacterium hagamense TaxID=395935 RepID=A0A511YNB4_9FLAO|nr:hypothetical protein CHA01nite_24270 [Chryseobacterium hagamense]